MTDVSPSVSTMTSLQSSDHSDLVLEALQSRSPHDLLILGADTSRRTHSDSLWIFSPLVRSLLGSLQNLQNNLLILPDFSSEDIKTGLAVLEGRQGQDLVFNCRTRDLLETLGVDLTTTRSPTTLVNTVEESQTSGRVGEILKEDEIDELLGTSDDEETIFTETLPNKEAGEETDDNDEENVDQNELRMYQDLSDSDNDDDDDENEKEQTMKTSIEPSEADCKEGSVELPIKMENVDPNFELIENILAEEQNLAHRSEKDIFQRKSSILKLDNIATESRPENFENDEMMDLESFNIVEETTEVAGDCTDRDREEDSETQIPEIGVSQPNIQKAKKQEIEKLLIFENDKWKCGACQKRFLLKAYLRKHVEIHVSGLSYSCKLCTETFKTRNRLDQHTFFNHGSGKRKIKMLTEKEDNTVKETREEAGDCTDQDRELDIETQIPEESKNIGVSQPIVDSFKSKQQKKQEIKELLVFENDRWKCRFCQKEFLSKRNLKIHAELHVSGLSYPCEHCTETFSTSSRLGQHKFHNHSNESSLMLPKIWQ